MSHTSETEIEFGDCDLKRSGIKARNKHAHDGK